MFLKLKKSNLTFMPQILGRINVFLYRIVKLTFLRNEKYYYSGYHGCDGALVLLVKNIFRPRRFITKLKYGMIPVLPKFIRSGRAAPPSETLKAKQSAEQLKRDGFLILHAAQPELADYINEKYRDFLGSSKPGLNYSNLILRDIDERLLSIMANEEYLRVISAYYNGRQPYLRATGSIKVTNPAENYIGTRRVLDNHKSFNTGWHYDTVNMVQIHFLLHDLEEADTHMKLVKSQNLTHRLNLTSEDYYYSDEYIEDNYSLIPFCGKKGTVIIWDSNSPHRAHPVVGRPRSFLQLLYSPGNDILTQNPKFGKSYTLKVSEAVLNSMSPITKRSLEYVLDDQSFGGVRSVFSSREGVLLSNEVESQFEISNF